MTIVTINNIDVSNELAPVMTDFINVPSASTKGIKLFIWDGMLV